MNVPVLLPFGKTIYQTSEGQSVTSDTAFIVDTVLKHTETNSETVNILELGSGNGIISIMLKNYRQSWQITGLEIQPHLTELAINNADKVGSAINFINGDLKTFQSSHKMDYIVSNPPYFPKNEGRISPIKERAISRHEIECNLEDVLNSVKRNLADTGRAFLVYPISRWNDLLFFAKKVDLIIHSKFISDADVKKIFVAMIGQNIVPRIGHK